ncbi:MAG: tetratricopeptide repeat protein [Clostridia bacterium]|nr:tetratricopeptide repeat protein [Clostridia bacterium]
MDLSRIISVLDEHYSRNDTAGAERHLLYWLEELGGSPREELALLNECIGFYRKKGTWEQTSPYIDRALALADSGVTDPTARGTTFINAGTACVRFSGKGKDALLDTALECFEKARLIYERELTPDDVRLGGLYNNLATALAKSGDNTAAREYFDRALAVMKNAPGGGLEVAVTLLNISDILDPFDPENDTLLEEARVLLDEWAGEKDGYYAFVCDKCADAFEGHGYFRFASELRRRAGSIYERS